MPGGDKILFRHNDYSDDHKQIDWPKLRQRLRREIAVMVVEIVNRWDVVSVNSLHKNGQIMND